MNWVETLALEEECNEVICLGDFFDRPDLNSREITAINEINWNDLPHTFLVGNHDASCKNLEYNSVNVLRKYGFNVIDIPTIRHFGDCDILFVPYLLDEDRKSLYEYFTQIFTPFNATSGFIKKIVLSHNDIKGLKYGGFESKHGFELPDIENNCDLFLNGHLHNIDGKPFAKHAFNIGNLTGQNFSEDALLYTHRAFILDTHEGTLKSIENPYAFNFYKLQLLVDNDLAEIDNFFHNELKGNAVLSIKCNEKFKNVLLNYLSAPEVAAKVVENRVIYAQALSVSDKDDPAVIHNSDDHLQKFISFCRDKLSDNSLLEEELAVVCKK